MFVATIFYNPVRSDYTIFGPFNNYEAGYTWAKSFMENNHGALDFDVVRLFTLMPQHGAHLATQT